MVLLETAEASPQALQVGLSSDIFSFGSMMMEVAGNGHPLDTFDEREHLVHPIGDDEFRRQQHRAWFRFMLLRYRTGTVIHKMRVKHPRFRLQESWTRFFDELTKFNPSERPTVAMMGKYGALFPVIHPRYPLTMSQQKPHIRQKNKLTAVMSQGLPGIQQGTLSQSYVDQAGSATNHARSL